MTITFYGLDNNCLSFFNNTLGIHCKLFKIFLICCPVFMVQMGWCVCGGGGGRGGGSMVVVVVVGGGMALLKSSFLSVVMRK